MSDASLPGSWLDFTELYNMPDSAMFSVPTPVGTGDQIPSPTPSTAAVAPNLEGETSWPEADASLVAQGESDEEGGEDEEDEEDVVASEPTDVDEEDEEGEEVGGQGTEAVPEEGLVAKNETFDKHCYCRQPDDGLAMVACDGSTCPFGWHHKRCIRWPRTGPRGKWYCPECLPNATKEQRAENGPASSRRYARPGIDADLATLAPAPFYLARPLKEEQEKKREEAEKKEEKEKAEAAKGEPATQKRSLGEEGGDTLRARKRPRYLISSDEEDTNVCDHDDSTFMLAPPGRGKARTLQPIPPVQVSTTRQAQDKGNVKKGAPAPRKPTSRAPVSRKRARDDDEDTTDSEEDETLPKKPRLAPTRRVTTRGLSSMAATRADHEGSPSEEEEDGVEKAPTGGRRRGMAWTATEERLTIGIMAEILHKQEIKGDDRWTEISSILATDHGVSRTRAGVKNQWNRVLRARCGLDERERSGVSGRPLQTGVLQKKKAAKKASKPTKRKTR
ncbi:MAG: hypothetical protein M1838_006023 [Thelocarpon superellum]|nr:MAG: hypothetical protein M1838_006023 [Thelocarpon superellum]